MKALRLHGALDVRLHEEPPAAPAGGEVLLRVTAVGLCGSDRHWYVEAGIGDAVLERPLVLGHEFAAVVASGPRAGERVAVDPAIACERCPTCLAGRHHLCLHGRFAGHGQTDGALRAELPWPGRLAHAVPDSLSDAEAALLEPLGVALHALDLGRVAVGAGAAVYGCGPLGLLLVQLLRLAGADPVVAADPLPHRLATARTLGAVDASDAAGFADVVFEVSGADEALRAAIDAAAPGGRVVLVGIPDRDRTSFPAAAARRKELALLLCRRMLPADLPRAIRLAAAGRVDLQALLGERFALDEGAEAFRALEERRSLKIVVEPQREAA